MRWGSRQRPSQGGPGLIEGGAAFPESAVATWVKGNVGGWTSWPTTFKRTNSRITCIL